MQAHIYSGCTCFKISVRIPGKLHSIGLWVPFNWLHIIKVSQYIIFGDFFYINTRILSVQIDFVIAAQPPRQMRNEQNSFIFGLVLCCKFLLNSTLYLALHSSVKTKAPCNTFFQNYANIDGKETRKYLEWLETAELKTGCFKSVLREINKNLLGKLWAPLGRFICRMWMNLRLNALGTYKKQ